jgi:ankyrin repeat protein
LIDQQSKFPENQRRTNFNIENIKGETALNLAVVKAHLDFVVWLLDSGADLNYVNSN